MDLSEDYIPIEPKTFEFANRTFKYDFNILTIEQVELAREAGEFKFNQLQRESDNFNQILRSGGADWLVIVMGFLLREYKQGVLQPFKREQADDVQQFVKSLPVSYYKDLQECVIDFFTGIKKKSIVLTNLQGERKKSNLEMLLPILQGIIAGSWKQGD